MREDLLPATTVYDVYYVNYRRCSLLNTRATAPLAEPARRGLVLYRWPPTLVQSPLLVLYVLDKLPL